MASTLTVKSTGFSTPPRMTRTLFVRASGLMPPVRVSASSSDISLTTWSTCGVCTSPMTTTFWLVTAVMFTATWAST